MIGGNKRRKGQFSKEEKKIHDADMRGYFAAYSKAKPKTIEKLLAEKRSPEEIAAYYEGYNRKKDEMDSNNRSARKKFENRPKKRAPKKDPSPVQVPCHVVPEVKAVADIDLRASDSNSFLHLSSEDPSPELLVSDNLPSDLTQHDFQKDMVDQEIDFASPFDTQLHWHYNRNVPNNIEDLLTFSPTRERHQQDAHGINDVFQLGLSPSRRIG